MADDNDLVRNRRVQYETAGLDVSDVDPSPVSQWHRWHEEAAEARLVEPNAMTVATVDALGVPDGRIVLARTDDAPAHGCRRGRLDFAL